MLHCRVILILLSASVCLCIVHAERARYDDLQAEDNVFDTNENEAIIETVKRFLLKSKKTTTAKPSSDALVSLLPTTPSNKYKTTAGSSIGIDKYGKKFKDACGSSNPCQNGGTCRTLASGRHYCYCTEQYYGRNCEKKFKSTGYENTAQKTKGACASSPCLHAGECVPLSSSFFCRCKTPYHGLTCNKRLSKREEIVGDFEGMSEDLQ